MTQTRERCNWKCLPPVPTALDSECKCKRKLQWQLKWHCHCHFKISPLVPCNCELRKLTTPFTISKFYNSSAMRIHSSFDKSWKRFQVHHAWWGQRKRWAAALFNVLYNAASAEFGDDSGGVRTYDRMRGLKNERAHC